MSWCLRSVPGFAAALLSALLVLSTASGAAFAADSNTASLITFGPKALEQQGDHDFRQLIHFSVPEGSAKSYFRVFDADVGGAHDERYGTFDTSTEFTLYGAGAVARLYRDKAGVVREELKGTALESVRLGVSPKADDAWLTLFAIDPARGELRDGRRHFIISVKGVAGDDGNVFGVALARSETTLDRPDGVALFSNLPTFQVPAGKKLSELGFALPPDARTISVENFDAAGAQLFYAGRFRSEPLTASGKNAWKRNLVDIGADEAGGPGSITVANGDERPNDVTVFAGVANDGGDPIDRPLGINMPPGTFTANRRPELAHTETSLDCRYVRFDASATRDPEGGPLRFVWKLPPQWQLRPGLAAGDLPATAEIGAMTDTSGNPPDDGARIERRFDAAGILKGRLEGFDGSGMIASGAATEFDFLSKAAPVATFTAPALLGEGEDFTLDGLGSTPPSDPAGTRLVSYRWEMGDGTVIEQKAGARDFGRPTHRYARYGLYEIRLTVKDDSGRPCNTATASKAVRVNAPPVANAGQDRKAAVDQIITFDAGLSKDPDGQIAEWEWSFPDGSKDLGRIVRHAFHQPGTYKVRLVVHDDTVTQTGVSDDTIDVVVAYPDNQRPVAVAGEDLQIAVGSPIWFDAKQSHDPDGKLLSYRWDFGDGSGAAISRVQHTFWKTDVYPVTLTVTDDSQNGANFAADTLIAAVTPAENSAPLIDLPETVEAFAGETVTLDGRKASDRDGSIIKYDWDLGDGERAATPVVKHVYSDAGTYTGNLILTDNGSPEPATANRKFVVKVSHRINTPPIAHIKTASSASAEDMIEFDASASTDPDGSILSYQWDFGDGQSATGIKVFHAYQFAGSYVATLKIVDDARPDDRKQAVSTATLKIGAKPNIAPVAVAGGDVSTTSGKQVNFDGGRSSDPDGVITAYLWTFGDGTISHEKKPRHTFHDPGVYRVVLRVTDNGTSASTAENVATVTVKASQAQELVQ